jgi:hypothetical protein
VVRPWWGVKAIRTYGRLPPNEFTGYRQWVEVTTDAAGLNDLVYVTTLAQTLLLNLNESPFYADWGIPAQQTIMSQVFPDYYITLTQQRYQQYFMSLLVSRENNPAPTYRVNVTTNQGVKLNTSIPVPT